MPLPSPPCFATYHVFASPRKLSSPTFGAAGNCCERNRYIADFKVGQRDSPFFFIFAGESTTGVAAVLFPRLSPRDDDRNDRDSADDCGERAPRGVTIIVKGVTARARSRSLVLFPGKGSTAAASHRFTIFARNFCHYPAVTTRCRRNESADFLYELHAPLVNMKIARGSDGGISAAGRIALLARGDATSPSCS